MTLVDSIFCSDDVPKPAVCKGWVHRTATSDSRSGLFDSEQNGRDLSTPLRLTHPYKVPTSPKELTTECGDYAR